MSRYTAFFLTILILVLGGIISAPAFTFATSDPPGSVETHPFAINEPRQIVGFFYDPSDVFYGFLRNKDGTFTTIDPLSSTFTDAGGENNNETLLQLQQICAVRVSYSCIRREP